MKQVIKASAGTGKTYRLSLEYIAALLDGQDFSEIVVLTFTRKATAEARDRILTHLGELVEEGEEAEVWKELNRVYHGCRFKGEVLKDNRDRMLLNKDGIHIYTIDSFTNRLFREVVAPYLGLYDYDIVDEEKDSGIIEEVFRRLLESSENFQLLEKLLKVRVARNYDKALRFIRQIVQERWKFLLIEHQKRQPCQDTDFLTPLDQCLEIIEEAAGENRTIEAMVKGSFKNEIGGYLNLKNRGADSQRLKDYVAASYSNFIDPDSYFWNGSKVTGEYKERALEVHPRFQERLARYVFNQEVIPLEENIFQLEKAIFAEYDRLKFRRGVFTHLDISNYVFKHLVREGLELPGGSLGSFLARMTGSRISSLFIDEFQDTSVLQWKILSSLIESGNESGADSRSGEFGIGGSSTGEPLTGESSIDEPGTGEFETDDSRIGEDEELEKGKDQKSRKEGEGEGKDQKNREKGKEKKIKAEREEEIEKAEKGVQEKVMVDPERPENFIAVGDAKQSIYGWRGGEKELFISLPGLLEGEIQERTLPTCYRSDREVLNFINGLFLGLRPDWDYEEVEPREGAAEGYVEVLMGGRMAKISEDTKKFENYTPEKQQRIREQNEKVVEDLPGNIALRLEQDFESYRDVAVLARSNDDLKEIANHLAERGVPYTLYQERSILENRAVEPLYQLLFYLWQKDYHCLLNFLRSDLVQLPQDELKFMLKARSDLQHELDRARRGRTALDDAGLLKGREELLEVLNWIVSLASSDYRRLAYRLITESGAFDCWQEDRGALKNLYRFYSLMQEQESLSEFMEFCREEEGTSRLEEAVIQEENAVDLLTVHKAKGLSRHTVFFYWKISPGRGGSRDESLKLYLNLDAAYQKTEDYLLSSSEYDGLQDWLDFDFKEEQEQQGLLEEVNNIYVALTRAKHNLFVWLKAGAQVLPGEEEAWKNNSDKYNFYEPGLKKAAEVDSLSELIGGISRGSFVQPEEADRLKSLDAEKSGRYFRPLPEDTDHKEELMAWKKDTGLSLKRNTDRMLGLAIHYYLEHIYHGSPEEMQEASRQTTARYGNILGDKLIKEALDRAESFISENPRYFQQRWEVFNEYQPVGVKNGEDEDKVVARIDRLLLDREDKKIIILDYKSGRSREEEQLERYRELIKAEAGEEYEVEVEFLEV